MTPEEHIAEVEAYLATPMEHSEESALPRAYLHAHVADLKTRGTLVATQERAVAILEQVTQDWREELDREQEARSWECAVKQRQWAMDQAIRTMAGDAAWGNADVISRAEAIYGWIFQAYLLLTEFAADTDTATAAEPADTTADTATE